MKEITRHLIAIANKYSISKLVLYGSRARGDFTPQSDIDIAIYGNLSPEQELNIKDEIESIPTLLKIDVLFCHRCTNQGLLKNIQKEGVILMDKLEAKKENFSNAVIRLEESIESYNNLNDTVIRDGMIQRFEFSIELAWKTIRAYLIEQGFSDLNSPKMVLKEAYSSGIITDQEIWIQMLQDRNQTSHMYSEDIACEIANRIIHSYLEAFKQLLKKL